MQYFFMELPPCILPLIVAQRPPPGKKIPLDRGNRLWYISNIKSEIYHITEEVFHMMRKRWYGLIGLLSLLGFVGVFTPERYFLGFFAFAVDFQYFFLRPDEMQEGQILRSAALGFFSGMGVTALAVLAALALGGGRTEALYLGAGLGWGVSVAVYAVSSFWASLREWRHAGP